MDTKNYVYIKLLSGEIILFEYKKYKKNKDDNYKIKNLQQDFAQYLNVEPAQLLFYYNYMPLEIDTDINDDNIYNVFINDLTVKITFDRTIRIHHEYIKMPRIAIVEIVNLTDKAYRYIYNELDYVSRGDGDFLINQYYFDNFEQSDDQLFINLLDKYNLKPFPDDQDFKDLDKNTKLNLISAYLFECIGIYLDIESSVFIDL